MKTNDILVSSGGWECTYPTFYKVIDVKNDYVTLRELDKETSSYEPHVGTLGSGTELPTDNFVGEKTIRRKVKQSTHNNESYVVIQKSFYLSAHVWDGKPQVFDYRNI